MPVHVVDRLPRGSTRIGDHVQAIGFSGLLDGSAKLRQERSQVRGELGGQLGQRGERLFRDQKDMTRIDRVDVEKRQRPVRF